MIYWQNGNLIKFSHTNRICSFAGNAMASPILKIDINPSSPQISHSLGGCGPPCNTPMTGPTPLTTSNGSSIDLHTFTQLRHKVSSGYNGMPHINPQNYPLLWAISSTNYLSHPRTQPTHHSKCHPDPAIFPQLTHWTDTQIDRQTSRWQGQQTCKNTRLRSVVLIESDVANNNCTCFSAL